MFKKNITNLNGRRVYDLEIDETDSRWGVDAISLVNMPAIEKNFYAFNDQKNQFQIALSDNEKRMLIGAALIPDKEIVRFDDDGEYYIRFSKETVAKAAHIYLKRFYQHNTTLEHHHNVSDCFLVESWIKESELDKSFLYGIRDIPNGTWVVMMKIDNDDVWNKIKNGEQKGFSIEGLFTEMAAGENLSTQKRKQSTAEQNKLVDSVINLITK